MSAQPFGIGEIVDTINAQRRDVGDGHRLLDIYRAGRFVVHAIHGPLLYMHPQGQDRARWNEYVVHHSEVTRPAPGDLTEEYGR